MKDINPILLPELDLERPIVIAGPCSAETREQVLITAHALAASGVKIFRAGVWKPRTHPGGFEGVGEQALDWLAQVKRETGMAIAVEVATPSHVRQALKGSVDILWIGARTSANPFAMQELADALQGVDIPVMIKNPVSPDLDLWIGAIQRIYNAGIRRIAAIHRGFTSFDKTQYRNQPLWSIPIELHRRYPQIPLLCDPSHIGGARGLVAPLSQQALDMNFDGLIIECHCNPLSAWSDAAQQVTPVALKEILSSLVVSSTPDTTQTLAELRSSIDHLDDKLLELLHERMSVCEEIGHYKRARGIQVLQPTRYDAILERRLKQAHELGLSPDFVKQILQIIHEESVSLQIRQ